MNSPEKLTPIRFPSLDGIRVMLLLLSSFTIVCSVSIQKYSLECIQFQFIMSKISEI